MHNIQYTNNASRKRIVVSMALKYSDAAIMLSFESDDFMFKTRGNCVCRILKRQRSPSNKISVVDRTIYTARKRRRKPLALVSKLLEVNNNSNSIKNKYNDNI